MTSTITMNDGPQTWGFSTFYSGSGLTYYSIVKTSRVLGAEFADVIGSTAKPLDGSEKCLRER